MAKRAPTDDDILAEGTTPYAEAGVSFDELYAEGYFDCVTDAHRAKARAYFAKIEAKRNPVPVQGSLFA